VTERILFICGSSDDHGCAIGGLCLPQPVRQAGLPAGRQGEDCAGVDKAGINLGLWRQSI